MAAVTILYQTFCPYCRFAKKALEALAAENPTYAEIDVTWIEENRQPAEASRYEDYWYVPTVYCGMTKLYEADPAQGYEDVKASLKAALDRAIEGA